MGASCYALAEAEGSTHHYLLVAGNLQQIGDVAHTGASWMLPSVTWSTGHSAYFYFKKRDNKHSRKWIQDLQIHVQACVMLKNVLWNHRLQEQHHKKFHPYYAWAKARSSTPNKREDLLSLMHILSATIKVAGGAWIHDGKILKRYLWRNTSKPSWLLGKNNFIFLLGDYNLLLRKKGQFVLKVFFVKMKCTYLSKNSIKVERNCFLYWWITDYIKRRVYNIIYCIS